jgi:hypothetical protein
MKTSILFLTLLVAPLCFIMAQNPLIYLDFNEGKGTSVANTGTRGGSGSFESVDPRDNTTVVPMPEWSTNVPSGTYAPGKNSSSINFGTNEWRSVYFDVTDGLGTDGLTQFTIAGWVNVTSTVMGAGGNRIISTWLGGKATGITGVDLVILNGTRLRIGVNSGPDYPSCGECGPYSAENSLTVDETAAVTNWKFFAVTYSGGNITYYFGDAKNEVAMDALGSQNYVFAAGRPVAPTLGGLAVGQFTRSAIKAHGFNRGMYGLLDEIRVYSTALDLNTLKTVQKTPIGSGIHSAEKTSTVDIYPNPVTNTLKVDLIDHLFLGSKLIINTIGGQIIHQQVLDNQNNRIDVQCFPKGVYLLTIKSNRATLHKTITIR